MKHDKYGSNQSDQQAPRRTGRAGKGALLAFGLLLAACSGGAPAAAASRASKHTQSPSAFAACMRSHGVPNFPDPNSQGSFTFSGTSVNPNSASFKSAYSACRSRLPSGGKSGINPQVENELLKFSACIRRHGFPDFPDPAVGSDGGVGLKVPKDIDLQSPQFQAAEQACRSDLPGGGPTSSSNSVQGAGS